TNREMKVMNHPEKLWVEWAKIFIIALALTVFVRTFLFASIVVDGSSMLLTLHDRDKMIVNKFDYHFKDPERFDIIVFHASEDRDFIERIIGLPGEHVEVRNRVLYIDGEKVPEPFLAENDERNMDSDVTIYENFTLEELPGGYQTILDAKYLVLGDNRNNSTDSRVIGLISKSQIVGKTDIIIWPISRWQTLNSNDNEVYI